MEHQEAAIKAALAEAQIVITLLTQRCAAHAGNIAVLGLKLQEALKEKHAAADAPPDPAAR